MGNLGRPRKLEENDLHKYWRRKAKERKKKSEVENLVDNAFTLQPKRSCKTQRIGV